ncbi:hypothetical protein [Deefgea sp. CFH1-16]|uniref:hypothetical protein n=1 Tax=Deefgea sp. CFH1-16 TaxID=2675457 RepID=UPI0015F62FEE|nr:hypothetical protein [Deefgea sp. CFH1-16]MBM5575832.1 hypothetical protein [Deefgea sp. CFH1-16]
MARRLFIYTLATRNLLPFFKNHLFLSFAGGRFVHSTVGDPTLYGAGASEFGLGAEITGFRLFKGGLIITTEKSIHTLFGSSKQDWQLDTFTDQIGAQADTVHDVVGDLFFFHKSQGFNFKAAQEYGKFATDSITKKINNSLATVGVKFCLVSPTRSAYLIQANDKRMFSMIKTPDSFDFGIRSYPFNANCGMVSPDGAVFVGTSSGFIYQLDRGYSADGAAIDNLVRTGFITPKSGKIFRLHKIAAIFSGQASAYQLRVDCDFDESSGTPMSVPAPSGGALWDSAQWNGSIFDSYPAARVETYPSATAESFAIMLSHNDLLPMRVLSFEFTLSLRGAKK